MIKPTLAPPAAKRKHRIITPGFACIMLLMFCGIGAVVWVAVMSRDYVPEHNSKIEDVSQAFSSHGVIVEKSRDGSTVNLVIPIDQAMVITEREANELALNTRSRLGSWAIVKVKSPAGQTLGSAP
jgi:hypothetical protein